MTIAPGPHTMNSDAYLEAQQAPQAAAPAHVDYVGHTTGDRLPQVEAQIPASIPTFDAGPRNTTPDSESEEPHMIGDFDGSANEFWKLYRDEAKSHDDARINTLKEGMDSALIFAGLFSAVLTGFVVDSKQNLKAGPADETVYYLRQHSTILSQISVQLSSLAPQVAISPTPPPPFPPFSPLASDIRVNVFWFMALAFSLLAALLAILVQQCVRNYMHVFQRYSDPLKSSRLRQYLYEGCDRWYMPKVADAVTGFLHLSLFLFFAGLGDSLLNINTKVALSAIVPVGISGLLYIVTTFAPIIYPQSPYQNSFSGMFWYLFQKSHGRRFKDRGTDGEMKSVSTSMAQGQIQLAMEATEARKGRDVRAICWLIDNLTEDAEMETFLSAIPGSFSTDWGTEVWRRVGEHHESEVHCSVLRSIVHLIRKPPPRHPPTHATTCSPVPNPPNAPLHFIAVHIRGKNVVHELSNRVARSVEICKNRGLFSNDYLWRKRTRACIEDAASLVFRANANFAWFGGISGLLGDIGSFERMRELSLSGTDESFVMRWTCLSLVAIRPILEDNRDVQDLARRGVNQFAEEDGTGNNDALVTAQRIDETFQTARGCLFRLYDVLSKTEDLTEEVKEILRGYNLDSQISDLEQIRTEVGRLGLVDSVIFDMQNAIYHDCHQIISQFPGVLDDFSDSNYSFSRFVELTRDPPKLQFMRPGKILWGMCTPARTLRNILKGQEDADAYKELLKDLHKFCSQSRWQWDGMRRPLWCLQDLHGRGGLGFTVELFFLALSQLLSMSSSTESHFALFTGTFRAITADWSKHKASLGTQNLLLDIAMSRRREFNEYYPTYIADEFLLLLGNILKGQTGPHIDKARQQFESFGSYDPRNFRERVLRVLNRGQAQPLTS